VPKAHAKSQVLFCVKESFAQNGEAFEMILARAVKVLLMQAVDSSDGGKVGVAHEA